MERKYRGSRLRCREPGTIALSLLHIALLLDFLPQDICAEFLYSAMFGMRRDDLVVSVTLAMPRLANHNVVDQVLLH